MNKFIKNNLNKILAIYILSQSLIDFITGIFLNIFNMNLTFGIIIRMLFLVFIMYTTLIIYKKRKSLIYYIAFLLFAFLYLIGNIVFKQTNIFSELQGLFRVYYFPLLLISLYDLKDEIRISKLTITTSLFMYLSFIFIPILLNIGFKSYEIAKFGTLGFFNSANEISGIISVITPFVFVLFKETKTLILKIILLLIYLYVILTIGTKTPLLALLITIGMSFIWTLIDYYKNKKYKNILRSILLITTGLFLLIIVIPKTNFYKNIKVHLNYLKVDNIVEIFEDEQLIDHFVFSERLTFYTDKKNIYENSNLYQKLFGIGYINNNKVTKLIEIDYYDIYFSHGLIGFLLFIAVPIYILLKCTNQENINNYNTYMTKTSFFLILLLSFFTGHIITAPSVSIIAIIVILYLDCTKKKNLLFAAYNLDLGGIETALINLLDNINYSKYNVTVILEQKSGILLNKINNNVTIEELKVSNLSNKYIRKIINLIRKINFTILNYNSYDFSCCYATYSLSCNKIARIASKNNSIYIHSDYKQLYKNSEDFKNFFDKRNISQFRKIIFVSNESKESFLTIYDKLKNKTEVINNFVDIQKIKTLSQEKINTKKNPNKKLFVFIGRLDDTSKKVKRAISIAKEIEEIELWIIGDGPDKKMYEDYTKKCKVEDRVTFLGRKINPYPYMLQADFIILTSDYEGFPVVYLEAIILNKNIITTIAVSDEYIRIGQNYGYIISKDEKKAVKEVKTILNKPVSLNKIDISKIQNKRIKKLEEIFNEVI